MAPISRSEGGSSLIFLTFSCQPFYALLGILQVCKNPVEIALHATDHLGEPDRSRWRLMRHASGCAAILFWSAQIHIIVFLSLSNVLLSVSEEGVAFQCSEMR
jgi:hypothetical protein